MMKAIQITKKLTGLSRRDVEAMKDMDPVIGDLMLARLEGEKIAKMAGELNYGELSARLAESPPTTAGMAWALKTLHGDA